MAGRALVLGGGGVVGVAWLTGLVHGLQQAGVDVSNADLFVGTSAGSCVCVRLANGDSPATLIEEQRNLGPEFVARARGLLSTLDVPRMQNIFAHWTEHAAVTQRRRAEVGAMAIEVTSPSEAALIEWLDTYLAGRRCWPSGRTILAAVDCETGDLAAWDNDSGVPIERALASSCAVPGIFPPITINERRYMDGGVRSDTNADLAVGHDRIVVVAPLAAGSNMLASVSCYALEAEVGALRRGGARVEVIVPDAAAMAAFGPNMMALNRGREAVDTGLRQGSELAASVADVWNG